MAVAEKIAALFAALRHEDIDAMAPAARRRFADSCRHWASRAAMADAKPKPRSGVREQLDRGDRSQ